MKKSTILISILIITAIVGVVAYFYMYMKVDNPKPTNEIVEPFLPFTPLDNSTTTDTNTDEIVEDTTSTTTEESIDEYMTPKLRQLSTFPIGGVSAINEDGVSIARYINRGTGHIYEARSDIPIIEKISNTTIPKIYESFWNKDLDNVLFRYLKDGSEAANNFYAEIQSTGSSTTDTPYEIKGSYLSPDIDEVAVSPNKDRVFTWNIENNKGVGYTSSFDGKNKVKVIDTAITQSLVDWPETNTLVFTTKPSAGASGYSYSINTKTGAIEKILGGIKGLYLKMSSDKNKAIYSISDSNKMNIYVLNTKDGTSEEILFRTLADKCLWSNLRKSEVYCAVPIEIPSAVYPDDWYKGSILFTDQIWHLNTITGEIHLLANLLKLSDTLIDATDLVLDTNNDYLYFTNKRDLTLWSLDLSQ